MARRIEISESDLDEIRARFERALSSGRLQDGKFKFETTVDSLKEKATLRFSELAWHKMHALIRENNKEVGWHCLAERYGDFDNNEYYLSDVVVYPQVVTGSTVDQDESSAEWINSFPPEVKQKIRAHGHSHVNMSTSPSSRDNGYYREILDQLTREMFYIFMIWNKSGESTCWIYDLKKNILFEDKDITIVVNDDGLGLESFLAEAQKQVKEYKYTNPKSYRGQGTYGGKSGKSDKLLSDPKGSGKGSGKGSEGGYSEFKSLEKYDSLDEYYKDLYGEYYDPNWREME